VIDEAMGRISLEPRSDPSHAKTIGDYADQLWHIREYERLVALSRLAPHLMTMDEQEIWAVISEHGYYWRGRWVQEHDEEVWKWNCDPDRLVINRIAESWNQIVAVAQRSANKDSLPDYRRQRPLQKPDTDEIPF
jgi:hypothetical protein